MNDYSLTREKYDEKYSGESFYWSTGPSKTSFEVLKHMPPKRHLRLLDIGCGEGRNAVFFARNGYEVHAFDISGKGLEKAARLAQQVGVSIHTFQADFNQFRLTEPFDIIFSTGTLHFCDQSVRTGLFENLKRCGERDVHCFIGFSEAVRCNVGAAVAFGVPLGGEPIFQWTSQTGIPSSTDCNRNENSVTPFTILTVRQRR